MAKPIIGVSSDVVVINGHKFHAAGEKYLLPLVAIGALPRLLPSLGPGDDVGDYLQGLDGLLLTGSVSNIEAHHYGASDDANCAPFDPARDSTTLPVVRAALAQGLPLLAICRGLQELNVALGGSLHPRVHDVSGRFDHRAPPDQSHEIQYATRHPVHLTPGGFLAGLAQGKPEIMVNSLHWQAIDLPGRGLTVEATALDGTIEAVRVADAKSFALGIQWHPEWRFAEDPFSRALFDAFGAAVRRTA